jgi:hypothetical protein
MKKNVGGECGCMFVVWGRSLRVESTASVRDIGNHLCQKLTHELDTLAIHVLIDSS